MICTGDFTITTPIPNVAHHMAGQIFLYEPPRSAPTMLHFLDIISILEVGMSMIVCLHLVLHLRFLASPHSPHVHVEVEDQSSLLGQSFIEPSASQPSTSQLSASQPPASQSSTSQPSTSQPSISQPSTSSLDQLLSTFVGASLSPRQVCAIYRLSGSDYSSKLLLNMCLHLHAHVIKLTMHDDIIDDIIDVCTLLFISTKFIPILPELLGH